MRTLRTPSAAVAVALVAGATAAPVWMATDPVGATGSVALRYGVTTSWSWGLVGAALILIALGVLVFGYRKLGRR